MSSNLCQHLSCDLHLGFSRLQCFALKECSPVSCDLHLNFSRLQSQHANNLLPVGCDLHLNFSRLQCNYIILRKTAFMAVFFCKKMAGLALHSDAKGVFLIRL